MKVHLLAAAALALAALLVTPGPTGASPAAGTSAERRATAEGIIRPAPEFSTCQQGATHYLFTADGRLRYQLVSHEVDLSRYEGQRVRVSGTLSEELEGCPPLLTVSEVVPVEHGSDTHDQDKDKGSQGRGKRGQGNHGASTPRGCAFGNGRANGQTASAPGCEVAADARDKHEDQDKDRGSGGGQGNRGGRHRK